MFNFPTRIPRISRISTPSEFFPVRHSENRCLQRKSSVRSVRSVWEIKERKRAGWASIRSGRWFDNVEWWVMNSFLMGPSDYSGLHPADALSLVSDASRATLSRRLLLLQWFRYRPGRCCHHQGYPFRYPSQDPGWYLGWYPGWCHHLTEQRPSSA